MASTSQDQRDMALTGAKPKGKAPITAHRAFPLVVAMWFAALLGLGTLILPVAMIEGLIDSTGLAAIIPSAAPPLGATFRLGVAVLGAVLGAGLGLMVARKVTPASADAARRRSISLAETPRRTPLSARDDLGSDSFDSVASFATSRRRALAIEDEGRKSDFLKVAPLPGEDDGHGYARAEDHADEVTGLQYEHMPAARARAAEPFADEPLDLGPLDLGPLDLGECAEFTEVQEFASHKPAQTKEINMSARQVFSPVSAATPVSEELSAFETGAAEPLHFSPPSMARSSFEPEVAPQTAERQQFRQPEPAEEISAEMVAEPDPELVALRNPSAASFARPAEPVVEHAFVEPARTAEIPMDDLGLVQLVQRLGATLEKHREWSAQRAELKTSAAHFPRAVVAADFDMADPGEAAQAMAAFFEDSPVDEQPSHSGEDVDAAQDAPPEPAFAPPQMPQMFVPAAASELEPGIAELRPFCGLGQIDDVAAQDEDEDIARLAASFSLPRNLATAAPTLVPQAFADDDTPAGLSAEPEVASDNEDYPSLLEMKNPFRDNRPAFVRVEEPEPETTQAAVIFPHEAPRVSAARAFDPPGGEPRTSMASASPAPASDDQQRVLREALMNLQRIGKTA